MDRIQNSQWIENPCVAGSIPALTTTCAAYEPHGETAKRLRTFGGRQKETRCPSQLSLLGQRVLFLDIRSPLYWRHRVAKEKEDPVDRISKRGQFTEGDPNRRGTTAPPRPQQPPPKTPERKK